MSVLMMMMMFSGSDAIRKALGITLDLVGMAPRQMPWDCILTQSGFVLRQYLGGTDDDHPVLIVPAPIKRPYIFDLMPEVSVVRRLLDSGLPVYLMEWLEEGAFAATRGLSDYVAFIRTAMRWIYSQHERPPMLVAHSLGGTLAAIAAALDPGSVHKLVLIQAPLRFGEDAGALASYLEMTKCWVRSPHQGALIPGSLLDWASVAAVLDEFLISRWHDAWASLGHSMASAIHARVIRWTLDEFAPPAQLLSDVVQRLYLEDRFARGELNVSGRATSATSLDEIPIALVVDSTSRLVPVRSAVGALSNPTIFSYKPEIGVALQHVGPLVGRRAHREIWPRIIGWMRA